MFKEMKKNKIPILISLFNVLILMSLSYILNNQPIFTGEDLNMHAWLEWIKEKLGYVDHNGAKDALFINVAYDKQFVKKTDNYGMTVGNVAITDRSKLLKILQILRRTNTYKYIFLDVRFEKGYEVPEVDSLLYAEICNLDKIVVANHSDIIISDSLLLKKSALNEYKSTIVATNFVRYVYSEENRLSVPLYAYHQLTGKSIDKHGLFYTCDDRLCYNSLFIEFPVWNFSEYDAHGVKQYYNLGSDLLENFSERDMAILARDKYIVIGNMIEDVHDTYAGMKPGSLITFYAFLSLLEGKHFVSYGVQIFLAILFFIISIFQFKWQSLWKRIPLPNFMQSKPMFFALTFIEYSFILILVSILLYLLFSITISIILPSMYFTLQKTIINYKKFKV